MPVFSTSPVVEMLAVLAIDDTIRERSSQRYDVYAFCRSHSLDTQRHGDQSGSALLAQPYCVGKGLCERAAAKVALEHRRFGEEVLMFPAK